MWCLRMASSRAARERRCHPPRALILDTNPPGWAAVKAALCEALGNSLSLGAAMAPPGDLLSVYIVREKHQCLLSLLQLRGNLLRLQSCLSELRSSPVYGRCALPSRSLSLAVLDALQQNRQFAQHAAHHSYFTEVTVLSTRPGCDLASELNEGLKDTDLSALRRLLVVRLSCDPEEGGSSSTSPDSSTDQDPSFQVYDAEFREVPADVLSLESFLKSWLFVSSGDGEQIRLILPTEDTKLQVICDIQHPLLPPGPLLSAGAPAEDGRLDTRLTQTIRIVKSMSSQGVCGSMLYGLPSILTPTACWELDWDQLESNQENFQALCHLLQSQELSLLGCRSQHSAAGAPPLLSHVIVSASDSPALLLRPVAPRELVLPIRPPALPGAVTDRALRRVQEALRCLEVASVYNPLQVSSNLYKHLQATLSRPAAPVRPITPAFRGASGQSRQVAYSGGKARATIAPLPLVTTAPCKRGLRTEDKSPAKIRFAHDNDKS